MALEPAFIIHHRQGIVLVGRYVGRYPIQVCMVPCEWWQVRWLVCLKCNDDAVLRGLGNIRVGFDFLTFVALLRDCGRRRESRRAVQSRSGCDATITLANHRLPLMGPLTTATGL